MKKILVVGDGHSKLYEQAIFDAFVALGFDVDKFFWSDYFGRAAYSRNSSKIKRILNLWPKIQYHYLLGPIVNKLNRDLLKQVDAIRPELVFVYRGTHILPATLRKIKQTGAIIFGYNNDDPFSHHYPKYFWRHFLASIFLYDHIFAYRQKNIEDYKKINLQNVSFLRSYYIKSNNYHLNELPTDKYVCDVVFVGHFENDGRDVLLKSLVDNNVNLRLFGSDWHQSKYYNYFVKKCGSIDHLNSQEYNLAINSAKIAMVFLSKLNNDTYTRRVFEITAAKTLMLSVYTEDLDSLFKSDAEAVYFSDSNELIDRVKHYLSNASDRNEIIEAAYQRLLKDGHEVNDRAREVVRVYQEVYEKSFSH